MSEHVTIQAPPPTAAPVVPDWLRQRFLAPGEPVVWWQGPTEGRWQEWIKNNEQPVMLGAVLCGTGCTLGGMLLGAITFLLGFVLCVGLLLTATFILTSAEKHKWQVITDRRLFVVTGRKKTEEFDLALLRQLLGAIGTPAASPASEQVIDLGKVGAIGGSSQSVTDLASVLAMAKLLQQVQGASKVMPS